MGRGEMVANNPLLPLGGINRTSLPKSSPWQDSSFESIAASPDGINPSINGWWDIPPSQLIHQIIDRG